MDLRIDGECSESFEWYTGECRDRVRAVFQTAAQVLEAKKLLQKIKEDFCLLKHLILTQKEKDEMQEAAALFDARMQMMRHFTFENLEKYRMDGWRDFFDGVDSEQAGCDRPYGED